MVDITPFKIRMLAVHLSQRTVRRGQVTFVPCVRMPEWRRRAIEAREFIPGCRFNTDINWPGKREAQKRRKMRFA